VTKMLIRLRATRCIASARFGMALIFLGATGWFASPAMASTTIQIAINTATPEQAIPVQIGLSGNIDPYASDTQGNVLAVIRPAGGISCQPTFTSDETAVGNADKVIADQENPTGPFNVSESYDPANPGSYLVCAWVEQGSNDVVTAGPTSTTFAAQAPQVPEFTVGLPTAPTPNRAFQVAYTTQTDQQLELDSTIKPAGGAPCGATFELEEQQAGDNNTERVLFSGQNVYGGPTTATATSTQAAGSYVICSWIEGPNDGEVDAASTTPFTIPPPPPPTPKPAKARLQLTHATASRKHGAEIQGTTATGLTGRIVVYATCGRASTSATPRDNNGNFSGHIKLPRTCRKGQNVSVGAVWPGSSTFSKQTVSERIRVRK
jgi:hypothetical protein